MSADYDVSQSFKRIENELIESMVRNFKRHRVDEAREGFTWEQWQVLQLKELEKYRLANPKKFQGDFSEINQKVEDALKTTYTGAKSAEEAKILEQIKKGKIRQTRGSGAIAGKFFGVNAGRIEHLIEATKADFGRGEWAILRQANDQYRKIIFNAQMYSATGATYEQAVDMATKDFLKAGIQSITYKNGARHTMADYSRMALKTGQKRAYLMGEGDVHDKYGIHTVRVNKRVDACPLCVKWLGKVLVDDVYAGGTAEEARKAGVPLLSEAIDEGFLHPNCKDVYTMYIEGVSTPADPWSKDELKEIADKYNAEQALQRAEDMQASYQRMADNSLDKTNVQRYQARADAWGARADSIRESMTAVAEVAPIMHTGMRSEIPVKYDTSPAIGAIDVDDHVDILSTTAGIFGDRIAVKLDKRVMFGWDDLTEATKQRIRWLAPDLYGKGFYVQKKDLDASKGRLFRPKNSLASFGMEIAKHIEDAGFKVLGYTRLDKYDMSWRLWLVEKDGRKQFILDDIAVKKQISKGTVDAVVGREKEVSKVLWDKHVRFRNLTSRSGDDWVKAMEEFHTAVEADKPVTLVTREAYDKVKGEELYRGIAPQSHLRGDLSMTKTPMECAEQLIEGGVGNCFPSRGIYGDCIAYLSNSTRVGRQYAGGYGGQKGGVVCRMKLKDDAKGIEYDDAKALFEAIRDAHPNDHQPYFSSQQARLTNGVEVGKAMQMLGYDYILQPRGDGMDVHFYMILNREALVAIKDDWVEEVL